MTKSMTGFAAARGSGAGWAWTWEIRSVNARGLDVRLRIPDWLEGLDQKLRALLKQRLARGSVTVSLRLSREADTAAVELDTDALDRVLGALKAVHTRAAEVHGLDLAMPTAADVLGLRALADGEPTPDDSAALTDTVLRDVPALLDTFDEMRAAEGAALAGVITGQLDEIEALTNRARKAAAARSETTEATLRANLERILQNAEGADPDRVAQELALIAVKTDVTEEIDRLAAHVEAARALLRQDGPVGRKLDFLTQEFNREANTLCSKAQAIELTRIGLDLKAVIDQMREQVQNVE